MIVRPNKKLGFALAMPRERAFTLLQLRGRSCAFTLVELLIAAGITVVIVVLLGTVLGSLMNTASRASQRVDSFRDARAALQIIERDLSNLVSSQWNIQTSPVPTPTPQPVTRPAAYFAAANIWQPGPSDPPDNYSTGNPNGQIFALISTKSVGSAPAGDVCAVGYYCRWDGNRYTLRRFFNNSMATFNVMTSTASYASASPSPSPALYSPSVNDEVLAADVWNFTITMYNSAGATITYPYICDPSATTPVSPPAAIEISFTAMSPQAARTVMSLPNPSPAAWMNMNVNLVQPHTYQFRTRINLQ